jgi:hypothetical protein
MPIEEFKGGSHMIDARGLDKPVDHASWGPLRALYEWLKPATPSPHLPSSPSAPDHYAAVVLPFSSKEARFLYFAVPHLREGLETAKTTG